MFVGREAELGLLGRVVGQVREGTGGAVWVGGDPGIGKSALIGAGLAAVRGQGWRVCAATAHEQSPVFPLQVLAEALGADANGALAAAGESDPDPIRAGRAEIVGLLSAGQHAELVTPRDTIAVAAERLVVLVHRLCAVSAVVLVVDNAQWADVASLGVLVTLTRGLGQLPLLVVVAARSVPPRTEVTALRQALADAGGIGIELGPVSDGEIAEMVRQLIGSTPGPALAGQLAAAAGNPLYLRALIDALVRESRLRLGGELVELRGDSSDLPGTLPAAIGRRLGFLAEPVMSALRAAAVLGPVFSVTDLTLLTGQRASDLITVVGEAVTAGVVTDAAGGMLAFRHGLVHQTLYEAMPASMRAALHREAAGHLAAAGAPAERVAGHLVAAPLQTDAWVIDWVAGAASVLTQRAPKVAAGLLERARDGLGWQDSRRERLDTDLAMTRLMLGDNEHVVRLARPVLESTPDPALAGRAAWILGYALPRLGRPQEAIDVTGQALTRDRLPPIWSARLRASRATSLFAVGDYHGAKADAQRAETEGTHAGDRLAVGSALYTLARLDIVDRRTVAAGKDLMERALAVLGDEPAATDLVLQLTVNLGLILHALGQPAAADRMFAQITGMVDRGTPPRQAYARAFRALHAFSRGRWDDALAEVDAAAQLTANVTHRRFLDGIAAQVTFHRDDRASADAYLRGVADIQLTGGENRAEAQYLLVPWALAAERDANPAEALTRLLAVFDPDTTLELPRASVISTQWLPDLVRLALAVGKPAVAAAAVKVSAREADAQGAPPWTAAARHCQGLVDRDPDAVRSAAQELQSAGYPFFSAQALENAAVLHAEKGDPAAARAAWRQAIGIYRDLGAAWDIRRADTRLRRHNIRRSGPAPRRRPAQGWDALTPTEQKIARLVADGLSNPDIASQLFLSRNTVQTHVSHILTKLNAHSRTQIARSLRRRLAQP
jgi:DNA-binding CsgD family transcriptional regulator